MAKLKRENYVLCVLVCKDGTRLHYFDASTGERNRKATEERKAASSGRAKQSLDNKGSTRAKGKTKRG